MYKKERVMISALNEHGKVYEEIRLKNQEKSM